MTNCHDPRPIILIIRWVSRGVTAAVTRVAISSRTNRPRRSSPSANRPRRRVRRPGDVRSQVRTVILFKIHSVSARERGVRLAVKFRSAHSRQWGRRQLVPD